MFELGLSGLFLTKIQNLQKKRIFNFKLNSKLGGIVSLKKYLIEIIIWGHLD